MNIKTRAYTHKLTADSPRAPSLRTHGFLFDLRLCSSFPFTKKSSRTIHLAIINLFITCNNKTGEKHVIYFQLNTNQPTSSRKCVCLFCSVKFLCLLTLSTHLQHRVPCAAKYIYSYLWCFFFIKKGINKQLVIKYVELSISCELAATCSFWRAIKIRPF